MELPPRSFRQESLVVEATIREHDPQMAPLKQVSGCSLVRSEPLKKICNNTCFFFLLGEDNRQLGCAGVAERWGDSG